MEKIISEKEINELKKIKGEVIGTGITEDLKFILKEEGEEGLRKLENEITKIGFSLKYKEIRPMEFYPLWQNAVILTLIKKLFNYDDKKFQEMGAFESKVSFIVRLFAKYFFSPKRTIEMVSKMWRNYHTVGELKVVEYNEDKKYAILRIENLDYIPIACHLYKGYFSSIVQMIIGSKVNTEETKCLYRGDEYHEFLLKW